MNFNFDIHKMSLTQLRELSRNLIALVKADQKIINDMQILIDLLETKPGENNVSL